MPALVWFRSDLRTADNTAMLAACDESPDGVVGVFTVCPEQWREHDVAEIRVDFLLRTLGELKASLKTLNIPLKVIETPRFDGVPGALIELAKQLGASSLHFNAEYEVNERTRDEAVVDAFDDAGLTATRHHDQTVYEPGSIRTQQDKIYTVYSPFKKSWLRRWSEDSAKSWQPKDTPEPQPEIKVRSDAIPDRVEGFTRRSAWAELWPAGEEHARRRLGQFIGRRSRDYAEQRDVPSVNGTSTMSPYLSIGSISARQCLAAAVEENHARAHGGAQGIDTWISELIWREFYRQVIVGFPRVSKHRSFRPEYDQVEWKENQSHYEAWCDGRTGFPIVDAGMRQLKTTGWMHNRVRMIVAMFFTKDLFLDWRLGERHFMQQLIDGDLAQNNGGWQWSASTGTDAQPYFRVFNPWSQSKKFDSDGAYIFEHVEELRGIPAAALHDTAKLAKHLDGRDYPEPIVDHGPAREHAIESFKAIKKS